MPKRRNRQLRGSWTNIMDCYNRTDDVMKADGVDWYPLAQDIAYEKGRMAGYSHVDATMVGAGLISSLSPQANWQENIRFVDQIIIDGWVQKQTATNNMKALRILKGEHPLQVLRGLKVVPFYMAILDPESINPLPVIDRHAGAVYMGKSLNEKQLNKLSNVSVNRRISGAYINVARKVGIHPHTLQATTWIQWRAEKGIN